MKALLMALVTVGSLAQAANFVTSDIQIIPVTGTLKTCSTSSENAQCAGAKEYTDCKTAQDPFGAQCFVDDFSGRGPGPDGNLYCICGQGE